MPTYPLTRHIWPDRADQFDRRTSPCVVALPILRVSATTRARWPAYGAPGHRANDVAIVSTCSFVTIRLRRGSSTSASTTLDPQSSPATVNAPLNPSVSATGNASVDHPAIIRWESHILEKDRWYLRPRVRSGSPGIFRRRVLRELWQLRRHPVPAGAKAGRELEHL